MKTNHKRKMRENHSDKIRILDLDENQIRFLETAVRFNKGSPSSSRNYVKLHSDTMGFSSDEDFVRVFKHYFGKTPQQYYEAYKTRKKEERES